MLFLRTGIALAAIAISSCGGGGAGGTGPSVESVNGIAVPPALAGPDTATLAGVDSNSNGIRDEVERSLATNFGARPAVHTAASGLAREYQRWLVKSPSSQAEARALLLDADAAGACLLRVAGLAAGGAIADEVMFRVFSTKARLQARADVLRMAGSFEFPSIAGSCQ